MIEQKLNLAASELPAPETGYATIEHVSHMKKTSSRRLRLIAVIAALALLVGCGTAVVTKYHHYSGFRWDVILTFFGFVDPGNSLGLEPDYEDALKKANDLGITIPEAFGNSPVTGFETINTTDQDGWILSWLVHDYQHYWITYSIETEVVEQAPDNPDGTPGAKKTTVCNDERVSLYFGAAEGELWRDIFDYDESGTWSRDDLMQESYRTMEYRGRTLQLGTISYTYDYHDYERVWNEELQDDELQLISVEPRTYYHFCITWVDEANGVVFFINTSTGEGYDDDLFSGVSQDTLIEYAKQLIDLNS